jgi:hypothetical protein
VTHTNLVRGDALDHQRLERLILQPQMRAHLAQVYLVSSAQFLDDSLKLLAGLHIFLRTNKTSGETIRFTRTVSSSSCWCSHLAMTTRS